mgnify:CR=1 FL=1|jgi:hypothetical protein
MRLNQYACLLLAGALAAPLPRQPDACAQVVITHTNLPLDEAASKLEVYLTTLENAGGGEEHLQRLIVSGEMSRQLTRPGTPGWDIFVTGVAFSYSIHCWRYVELAGDRWNVLLCQQRAGHETGYQDESAASCQRADGLTVYSNGTLAVLHGWSGGGIETDAVFDKEHSEEQQQQHARRLPQAQALLSKLPESERSGGPDMAQHLRQRAEALWAPHVWNVIVTPDSTDGSHSFPNWNDDAKEEFHLRAALSRGETAHVIVFSRFCFVPKEPWVG